MKTDFRTTFTIPKSSFQLDHKDASLLLGSCFSENIEKKLAHLKFDCISNPLGISYHPISIHRLLHAEIALQVEEREGVFFSYQFHSELNQLSEKAFRANIERQQKQQQMQLAKQGTLIITYGTAWIYERKDNKTIVNNCQKTPSTFFHKRLLSVEEILLSWQETHAFLKSTYPQLNIVFTLSPVRHLKDGVRENQWSKSILNIAIQQICEQYQNCSYFPSYEIMMDDLRDYRFYESDLIHPNQTAIDYIWERFEKSFFSEETQRLNQEILTLHASIQHRAFQPQSEQHQQFLQRLLQKMERFQQENNISFKSEMGAIRAQIN